MQEPGKAGYDRRHWYIVMRNCQAGYGTNSREIYEYLIYYINVVKEDGIDNGNIS